MNEIIKILKKGKSNLDSVRRQIINPKSSAIKTKARVYPFVVAIKNIKVIKVLTSQNSKSVIKTDILPLSPAFLKARIIS